MGTATEKQINFLRALGSERVTEPHQDAQLADVFAGKRVLTSQEASLFITVLQGQARKPRTQAATPSPWAQAQAALADVDTSFYAIPAGYVVSQRIDLHGNDYLFIRVRNYQGKRYMSRVHGNVGGFAYSRMDAHTVSVLAALIVGRALEFQRNFHEQTGKCGRCAADLTDVRSRALGFGPDCAKIIGV